MDFEASAAIFKALADPNRLRVLHVLANPPSNDCAPCGSVCACDLEGYLGLSQPTISHHMRLLVQAGLVMAQKRGKWTDYTLSSQGFAQLGLLLAQLQAGAQSTDPKQADPRKETPHDQPNHQEPQPKRSPQPRDF